MDWASNNGKAVRQSAECEARDYTMFTLETDFRDPDSFSASAVDKQSVPSATRAMTSMSREDSANTSRGKQ